MAFLEGVHRGEIDKGLAAAEQIRSRASKKKQKQQLSHKRPRPVFAAEKEQQTKHQLQQKVAKLTWDNNVLRQKQHSNQPSPTTYYPIDLAPKQQPNKTAAQ